MTAVSNASESTPKKMRFFVKLTERECRDTQERAAMLRHRLNAIRYQQRLMDDGKAHYVFYPRDKAEIYLLYMIETLEELDYLLKRDPYFGYTRADVIPVVNTEALVREAQDFLGVQHFSDADIESGVLDYGVKPVDPDGSYLLAIKEVQPFSPLLSEEAQNEIHYRTILAQEGHFSDIEFSDENPVGMQVGITLVQGTVAEMKALVESCPVFPDTVVEYTELMTLKQAWHDAVLRLAAYNRPLSESEARWPFETVPA
jgi:muconolactone delta-isomerase